MSAVAYALSCEARSTLVSCMTSGDAMKMFGEIRLELVDVPIFISVRLTLSAMLV